MRRSDQRRDAVFALYQHEVTGRPLDDLLAEAKPFTRVLAHGVAAERPELDEQLSALLRGWTLDRVAPLDAASCASACTSCTTRNRFPPRSPSMRR